MSVERDVDAGPVEDDREKAGLLRRALDFVFGYDFFISYAWKDGDAYAAALTKCLEDHGFEVSRSLRLRRRRQLEVGRGMDLEADRTVDPRRFAGGAVVGAGMPGSGHLRSHRTEDHADRLRRHAGLGELVVADGWLSAARDPAHQGARFRP